MYLIATEMYQGVPRTNMNQPFRAQSQSTVANLIQLKKRINEDHTKNRVWSGCLEKFNSTCTSHDAQKVLFMTPLSPLSVKSLQAVCSIPPLNTS